MNRTDWRTEKVSPYGFHETLKIDSNSQIVKCWMIHVHISTYLRPLLQSNTSVIISNNDRGHENGNQISKCDRKVATNVCRHPTASGASGPHSCHVSRQPSWDEPSIALHWLNVSTTYLCAAEASALLDIGRFLSYVDR